MTDKTIALIEKKFQYLRRCEQNWVLIYKIPKNAAIKTIMIIIIIEIMTRFRSGLGEMYLWFLILLSLVDLEKDKLFFLLLIITAI